MENVKMLTTKFLKLNKNNLNNHKGFALIETLISVLLFLIGFIGVIHLTALMTQETNNAKYRSEAIDFANELNSYILFDKENISGYLDGSGNTIRQNWDNAIETLLPNGQGSVTYNPSNTELTIRISWQSVEDPDERQYEVITFLGD